MHLFYQPFEPGQEIITLQDSEARHCSAVLRCQPGDELCITNGEGSIALVRIQRILKQEVVCEVISEDRRPKPEKQLTLAITPLKNPDRTEWLLEKATEVGVTAFQFLLTRHCVSKRINMERLERVIVSATKQSEKHFKPQLLPLTAFEDFISRAQGQLLMATCAEDPSKAMLDAKLVSERQTCILIGPEGDFSAEEIDLLRKVKGKIVSLGSERLRSETAALTAAIQYQYILQTC